jgi:glycine dehydrogenase subunit 1
LDAIEKNITSQTKLLVFNDLQNPSGAEWGPAVCDEINGRGEFLTAYVGEPYADHGKWQALFEYASLMGELLDMDVLSCPLYDGMSAAATSLRMASRVNGRKEVLLPKSVTGSRCWATLGENNLSPFLKLIR